MGTAMTNTCVNYPGFLYTLSYPRGRYNKFYSQLPISALSTPNTQRPVIPTLVVVSMFTMAAVRDPGMLKYLIPSPALNPACKSHQNVTM